MRRRAIAGAALFAASVWCAAGKLTVANSHDAWVRLAVPAPWWIASLAFAAALFVPAWRRRPLLIVPATLATLPWWPAPLPAIALMWTGPLGWLPILAVCMIAAGMRPVRAIGRALRAGDCRRAMVLAGVLTLMAVGAAAWTVAPRTPGGDEPHYLMITQSLLKDHDLRIENNYRQGDFADFANPIEPHYLVRGRDGEIYSIHAPGVSVLVLPAFALLGYRGAEIFLLLLAGVTGSLVWRMAWRTTGRVDAAWFAWAAVTGSVTFLLQAFTIFPDGPAALIAAAAGLLLVRLRQGPAEVGVRALISVSILLAGLPWLNSRLAVLAVGLALPILWLLMTDGSRASAARRMRAGAFLGVPLLSAVGWFAFFQMVYGTPNPSAPYGANSGLSFWYVPGGLLGLLFDGQFGLAIYCPVLVVAIIGLVHADRGVQRWTAWAAMMAGFAYLATAAGYWIWWGGQPATPARLATAMLPLCAIPMGIAWTRADAARRHALLVLLTVSLGISLIVLAVDRGALAWNLRTGEPLWLDWLGPVVNLPRGWPSFFWSSRQAFAGHAAIWTTTFAALWLVVRGVARGRPWNDEQWRLAVATWLLAGIAASVQAGWWLTGASALDPARSQIALLTDAARGRRVMSISPFAVHRVDQIADRVTLRSEEAGKPDAPPPWFMVEFLPPGKYLARVSTGRPARGELRVFIGDDPVAVQRVALADRSRETFDLILPAGASRLTIAPDAALAAVSGTVELVPEGLSARVRPLGAFSQASHGHAVFFCDYSVVVDDHDEFKLKGGQVAELGLARQAGSAPVSLVIRTGAAATVVAIRTDAVDAFGRPVRAIHRQEALAPFDHVEIALPLDAGDGVRLTLSSSADAWVAVR